MSDSIFISKLEVPVHIGVPEKERKEIQAVHISLELFPENTLFGSRDDLSNTIDYYLVTRKVIELAQERPRKLIEQLNEDVLRMLIGSFPIRAVDIETRKYIIPETEYVSVRMSLTKEAAN